MSTYTFLSLEKCIFRSSDITKFVRLHFFFFSTSKQWACNTTNDLLHDLLRCLALWVKPQQMLGKRKKPTSQQKTPKQTLPSLSCQIIYMGRGSKENLCVCKGRCGKFRTILCLWFKNKTSSWNVLVSSFMKKYGQENWEGVWQVFWITADEEERRSFLAGRMDTEASAGTVVFRQVWFYY